MKSNKTNIVLLYLEQ